MRSLASIVAALGVLAAAPAHGYEWKRAADGAPVRLTGEEVAFRLPSGIPQGLTQAEVEGVIRAALEAWGGAAGIRVRLDPGDPDAVLGYRPGGPNHNDIVFIESDWPYDDGALGVALLTVDPATHAIVDADVALNAAQHRFRVLPEGNRGGIYDDLQGAVTHELGHTFGLEHSETEQAVMYPRAERGDISKRQLTADDRVGVGGLYAEANLERAFGCSAAAGRPSPVAFAAVMVVLLALARPARMRRAACRQLRRR